jgi:hypothetical protein
VCFLLGFRIVDGRNVVLCQQGFLSSIFLCVLLYISSDGKKKVSVHVNIGGLNHEIRTELMN